MNEIEAGSIPGFATYFYIIPQRRLITAARFQHSIFGHAQLRAYMGSFLRYCGRHAAYDSTNDDIQLLGYTERRGDEPRRLRAVFDSDPKSRDSDHARFVAEAASITKVVRKTALHINRAADRALWQRALQHVHLAAGPTPAAPVRIDYAIDVVLGGDEVREIIAAWQNEDQVDEWEDVGFRFRGDSQTQWLSHALARTELHLDIQRDSEEVVNAASLLAELRRNEAEVLRLL